MPLRAERESKRMTAFVKWTSACLRTARSLNRVREDGTTVVTDVAGDHVSKSPESTGGDFGAPHCSLLFASNKWLFELLSGCEH